MQNDQSSIFIPASDVRENARNDSLIADSGFLTITNEQSGSRGICDPAITTSTETVFSCDSHGLLDGLSKTSTNYCLQL